ncbi:MAG: FkbM family methyltransferase [Pelagibacteraceae bacterium]
MKDFGLVVIGAHFGIWLNEELVKYKNDNILLVEPVPYNFKILKENFQNEKNIFICTNAVFSENKTEKFYFVREDSIPKLGKHWASGIGSFSKEHLLNHKSKRFNIQEEDIDNLDVEFITFDKLVKNFEIGSIKKLQIDVEGAEFEILKSIDFKKININQIQFEFKHFDGTFLEGPKLKIIKEKLVKNGFQLTQIDKENILAEK